MSVAKNAIDQKEYLKKYLGGEKKKKKKKHRKKNVKIIDDYVFANQDIEIDIEDGEDAPQVVGEITLETKIEKWRSIVIKDEPDDEQEPQDNKANIVKIKEEFPQSNGKKNAQDSDPDLSPPRRRLQESNGKKNAQDSDPDLSPPRRRLQESNGKKKEMLCTHTCHVM